ncbi:MAG: TetR/AcrR family transcriptional regulator [Nonomuraea sp.]|nr:TetR/AcrR family transcriptional regulator [Nonomuraea sp.]
MNLKAERGAATREQLVVIATRLFAEHGYEGTSIEAVLKESGLSRGALYHHFAGKDALFEAVLEAAELDVAAKLARATAGMKDPALALRTGAKAWIRLAGDPVIRRILLIDAPSVLGWERWRAMEERHAFGQLKLGVQAMGVFPDDQVDLQAHVLLAAINELALLAARSESTADAEAAVEEFLTRQLRPR